jgi:hypothetical protein
MADEATNTKPEATSAPGRSLGSYLTLKSAAGAFAMLLGVLTYREACNANALLVEQIRQTDRVTAAADYRDRVVSLKALMAQAERVRAQFDACHAALATLLSHRPSLGPDRAAWAACAFADSDAQASRDFAASARALEALGTQPAIAVDYWPQHQKLCELAGHAPHIGQLVTKLEEASPEDAWTRVDEAVALARETADEAYQEQRAMLSDLGALLAAYPYDRRIWAIRDEIDRARFGEDLARK